MILPGGGGDSRHHPALLPLVAPLLRQQMYKDGEYATY